MMSRPASNLFLAAVAIALGAPLLTGCTGSAADSQAAPAPASSTTKAEEATSASAECAQALAEVVAPSTADDVSTEQLDALAFAGARSCRDLDDLRGALDDEFGSSQGKGLADFVISSCVAGDAWALLGQPSVLADTAVCKEARARYTVLAGRQLAPSPALFSDDFSGPCRGWSTDRDARVALGCVDGAYRVLVKRPDRPQHSRLFEGPAGREMSVEVDAVLDQPQNGKFELHGVSCWESPASGYLFGLAPDGSYVIVKLDLAGRAQAILKGGHADEAVPGAGARNRIRGDCRADDGRVELGFFVNGDRVAVVRDKGSTRSFKGFGLFVATSDAGTDVRFDNALVRGGASG